MITLEEFKQYFKAIEDYNKEWDNANTAIKMLCEDSHGIVSIGGKLLDAYIDLLEKLMGCEDNLISWYIFDTNMGTNDLAYYLKNGKRYDCNNLEQLYIMIMGGN